MTHSPPRNLAVLSLLLAVPGALALGGCGGGAGGGGASGSAAHTYSVRFQEFAVPGAGNAPADPHPGPWPDDLQVDPQGTLWLAEHHADEIGRLTPSGAGYAYQGFPVPTPGSQMDSVAVDSVRHRVWVSESASNKIALLDTSATSPQAVEISAATADTPDPVPGDLALDPTGNLWFTSPYEDGTGGHNALGRVDAATLQVRYIPTPPAAAGMDGITVDASGAVWFVELHASQIGRYAGGQFTLFPAPRPNAAPTNLALDAAGRVWVTEQGTNALAVLDPADTTGVPWHEYPLPTPLAGPSGIAVDGAGNVWCTELAAGRIGVLPSGSAHVADFSIPTPSSAPEDIQVSPDGRVFFSERYGGKVAMVTLVG